MSKTLPLHNKLSNNLLSNLLNNKNCVNEKPILGGFNWLSDHAEEVRAICAQGAPEVRRKLVRRAEALGVRFSTVVHPTAVLTRWVTIGEGTIITAGCIFCNQIKIGRHVLVNLDCTIAEDTILEDFATVGPGVHLGRGCYLNEGCNVGTGANIIEQVRIGAWSIVGAGGTIVKDVPTNSTVVGVPGTVIKTRSEGWYLD